MKYGTYVNSYAGTVENITLAKLLNVSVKRDIQNIVDILEIGYISAYATLVLSTPVDTL
jgi:hypothetical protein